MDAQRLEHPIAPVYDARSEVLVLGSFPSPASRAQGFFYGNPRNRMWQVLARVFDEPEPATVPRRRDFLLRHHIAMWDVLASCTIEGASDASIADAVPNDLSPLLAAAPIRTVLCAGGTAARLYGKLQEASTGIAAVKMPSTSPANAAWGADALAKSWGALRELVAEEAAPVLDVADVVALEQAVAASGTPLAELMDRAGAWLAHRVHRHDPQARVTVLAGNGNNGGDGWVAARELARQGHRVTLVTAKPAGALTAQPARGAALAAASELAAWGATVLVAPDEASLGSVLADADVVVDAILGTGFAHATVRAPFDGWIRAANTARARGAWTLAADCPSGLSAQTGVAADPHVAADETVTMIVPKPGLLARAGAAACGVLTVAPLCDYAPLLR